MEDLLASIRKAINEDIGNDAAAAAKSPAPGMAPRAATSRPAEEPSATSSEIQQLREKITRSRSGEPAAARDPAQRAASLAAALRSQTPRRAWRDLEPMPMPAPQPQVQPQPQPAPPRLRATILEPEAPRPPQRTEQATRTPRYTLERAPAAWSGEAPSVPAPREAERVPLATPVAAEAAMLSSGSAQAVQSAFSRLADTVLARAIGEQSIEEMTRELLKVMLKQWMDDNLPQLVERLVREEIERVARTGR